MVNVVVMALMGFLESGKVDFCFGAKAQDMFRITDEEAQKWVANVAECFRSKHGSRETTISVFNSTLTTISSCFLKTDSNVTSTLSCSRGLACGDN